jgi:AcrR family transcriptional regulator
METKERIIEKTRDLFLRLGIRSVSMDDVAGQMGMSKKTLYLHFEDKDELVERVVDFETNRMQDECHACAGTAENAVEEILKTMEMVMQHFRNMNPMVLFDMHKFHGKAYAKFMEHKNIFLLDFISTNLKRGVSEGYFRQDIKIDILAKFRLESMMLAFNMEAFPPAKYNVAEVTITMIENFLYGLATESGFKLIEQYKAKKNTIHAQ